MADTQPTSLDRLKALCERLRSPAKMTTALLGGILLLTILAGYMPADAALVAAKVRLEKAEKRALLGSSLDGFRGEYQLYEKRVWRGSNLTEWAEYLHGGVTKTAVRLVFMEPKPAIKLGPCTALTWSIELEGSFEELCRYVQWLESGERLVRIDRLVFDLSGKRLSLSITLRGLVRA